MYKQKKTLKLKNDYVFKAVFGADQEDSKAMLIRLLNLVLEREENPITEITLNNPYLVDENIDLHGAILDILAKTDRGEVINVEMQMSYSRTFLKRTDYYIAKIMNEQLGHGEDYDKIKPIIGIYFVDDVIFPDIPDYHTVFTMREKTWGVDLANYLSDLQPVREMHYLQLGRLQIEEMKDQRPDSMSELQKLCCFLRYEGVAGAEEWTDALAEREKKGLIGMIKEKLDTIRQDEKAYYDALSREMFLFEQHFKEKEKQELLKQNEEQKRKLEEKDALIEEQHQGLKQKDALIEEKEQGLKQKDALIEEKDQSLKQKDALIEEKEQGLKQKDALIEEKDQSLKQKDALIEELKRRLQEQENKMKS